MCLFLKNYYFKCIFCSPQKDRTDVRMAVTLERAPWLGWILVKALMRFAFMVANNLVGISSYVFYVIVLQPLRVLDRKSFWYIEGIMYKWLLGMVASWGWYAGYTGESGSTLVLWIRDVLPRAGAVMNYV